MTWWQWIFFILGVWTAIALVVALPFALYLQHRRRRLYPTLDDGKEL